MEKGQKAYKQGAKPATFRSIALHDLLDLADDKCICRLSLTLSMGCNDSANLFSVCFNSILVFRKFAVMFYQSLNL